jgi:hypothetical protein
MVFLFVKRRQFSHAGSGWLCCPKDIDNSLWITENRKGFSETREALSSGLIGSPRRAEFPNTHAREMAVDDATHIASGRLHAGHAKLVQVVAD